MVDKKGLIMHHDLIFKPFFVPSFILRVVGNFWIEKWQFNNSVLIVVPGVRALNVDLLPNVYSTFCR